MDSLRRHWHPSIRTDTVTSMDEQRLRFVPKHTIEDFCAAMQSDGFVLYVLDSVADAQSFFIEAKRTFPLDPPISGKVHWDAFSDSLWGGLDACKSSKIALVVRDADVFRLSDKAGFETALECMLDAGKEVEAEKRSEGKDDAEIVVVLGEG